MVTELTTLAACKLTAQAIASIYKGAKTISDVFLARKIEKFAEEPFSEKSKEYINSMDVNKFEELQEQIIHSLTHAESVLKALYVKNLTSAYCENKIDWSTFCRMNFVLGQIYTMDLISLVKFYNYEHDEEVEYDEHVWLSLKNAAVLVNSISDAVRKIDPDNAESYKKNTAAKAVVLQKS